MTAVQSFLVFDDGHSQPGPSGWTSWQKAQERGPGVWFRAWASGRALARGLSWQEKALPTASGRPA